MLRREKLSSALLALLTNRIHTARIHAVQSQ